jgi:hypothetical protein
LTATQAAREYGISRQRMLIIARSAGIGRKVGDQLWIFTRKEIEAYRPRIKGTPGRPPKLKPEPSVAT